MYKNKKWSDFKVSSFPTFSEVYVFSPSVYREYRGEIWTTYHSEKHPITNIIPKSYSVHNRFSKSYKNVLRGLHYDDRTWKLVQAVVGDIYLVVLDMNEGPTYGKWESYIISEKTREQVLIPPGFANGHYALTDCVFHYTMFYDNEYVDVDQQTVVKWNDPKFNIEWPTNNPTLQNRDR